MGTIARDALRLSAICLAIGANAAHAQTPPGKYEIKSLRWEEDYAWLADPSRRDEAPAFKYVPLGGSGAFVSFGGEVRARVDSYDEPFFGAGRTEDFTSVQTRGLAHADVHFSPALRAFVQLAASDERGRRPRERAADESALDLAQGFVDWTVGEGSHRWRLRAGRQELAFGRFITTRDGTNLRRTFDGVRATGPVASGSLDLFAAYVTDQRPDAFDDQTDDLDRAWGGAYTRPFSPQTRVIVTYFGRINERGAFAAGVGTEKRHSLAVRLQTTRGAFDFDGQFGYQIGELERRTGGALDIDAFGFATETGYTWRKAPWRPRVAVRIDRAGGDRNAADGELNTFDLAYPNLSYISDLSAFAARNLASVQPFVTVTPRQNVTLTAGMDWLWRSERADAVYSPPSVQLARANQTGGDAVASQFYLRANWRLTPFVDMQSSFVHAQVDDVLAGAGLADQTYGMTQIAWRF